MLAEAFRVYDKSGSGRVSAYDFRKALSKFGIKSGVNPIVKKFQSKEDGLVQYKQFLEFFEGVRGGGGSTSSRSAGPTSKPVFLSSSRDGDQPASAAGTAAVAPGTETASASAPFLTDAGGGAASTKTERMAKKIADLRLSGAEPDSLAMTPSTISRPAGRAQLSAALTQMDTDQSGILPMSRFQEALAASGVLADHPHVSSAIAESRRADGAEIDYDSFLAHVSQSAKSTSSAAPSGELDPPPRVSRRAANAASVFGIQASETEVKFRPSKKMAQPVPAALQESSAEPVSSRGESKRVFPEKIVGIHDDREEMDLFEGAHKKRSAPGREEADAAGRWSRKKGVLKANFFKLLDSEDSPFHLPSHIRHDVELRKLREMLASKLDYKATNMTALFRQFDSNGDGILTVDEFRSGLRQLGVNISEGKFAVLLNETDSKFSGEVDFREFVRVMNCDDDERIREDPFAQMASNPSLRRQQSIKIIPQHRTFDLDESKLGPLVDPKKRDVPSKITATSNSDVQDARELEASVRRDQRLRKKIISGLLTQRHGKSIRDVFRALDRDKNGVLDEQEFRDALGAVGVDLTVKEFERIRDYVDADGNGYIDYAEFARLMGEDVEGVLGAAAQLDDSMQPVHLRSSLGLDQKVRGSGPESSAGPAVVATPPSPPRSDSPLRRRIADAVRRSRKTAADLTRALDRLGNGASLSLAEVRTGLQQCGMAVSDADVQTLVGLLDPAGNGKVDISGLVRLLDPEEVGSSLRRTSSARSTAFAVPLEGETRMRSLIGDIRNSIRQTGGHALLSACRRFDAGDGGVISQEAFQKSLEQLLGRSVADEDVVGVLKAVRGGGGVSRNIIASASTSGGAGIGLGVDYQEFARCFGAADSFLDGQQPSTGMTMQSHAELLPQPQHMRDVPRFLRSHFDAAMSAVDMPEMDRMKEFRFNPYEVVDDADADADADARLSEAEGAAARSGGSSTASSHLPSKSLLEDNSNVVPLVTDGDAPGRPNADSFSRARGIAMPPLDRLRSDSSAIQSFAAGGDAMSTRSRPALSPQDFVGRSLKEGLRSMSPVKVRECFRAFDRQRSGLLSAGDFKRALEALDADIDEAVIGHAATRIAQPDGSVAYGDLFTALDMTRKLPNDEAAFRSGAYDRAFTPSSAHRLVSQDILSHSEGGTSTEIRLLSQDPAARNSSKYSHDRNAESTPSADSWRSLSSPRRAFAGQRDSGDILAYASETGDANSPAVTRRLSLRIEPGRTSSSNVVLGHDIPLEAHRGGSAVARPSTSSGILPNSNAPSPAMSRPSLSPRHRAAFAASPLSAALGSLAGPERKLFLSKGRAAVPDSGDISIVDKRSLRTKGIGLPGQVSGAVVREHATEMPLFDRKSSVGILKPEETPVIGTAARNVIDEPLSRLMQREGQQLTRARSVGRLGVYSPSSFFAGASDLSLGQVQQKLYQSVASPRQLFSRLLGPRSRGSGRLSLHDLQVGLRKLNVDVSVPQVRRLVAASGSSGVAGDLSYAEFCRGFLGMEESVQGSAAPPDRTVGASSSSVSPSSNRQRLGTSSGSAYNILTNEAAAPVLEPATSPVPAAMEAIHPVGPYQSPAVRQGVFGRPTSRGRQGSRTPRDSGDIIAWRQ